MEARLTKYVFICLFYCYANCLVPGLMNRGRGGTVPVQMDMVSDDSITICTGAKRSLGCREGANIAITNVFWGRLSDKICPSDDGDPIVDCDAAPDSMGLVKAQCEGKRECSLTAKHNLLQKERSSHCPGVNKYLVVKFTCVPESKGVLLCDSAESEIACEAGWTMQLADVFWGRRASARTCGLVGGFECDASEAATNYLKNKCNGQRHCLVQNDATILDPTKHSSCGDAMEKYLMLNYVCSPATMKDNTPGDVEEKPKKVEAGDVEEKTKKVEESAQSKVEEKPKAASSTSADATSIVKPSASASTLLANNTSASTTTSSSSTTQGGSNSKKATGSPSAKNEKTEEEEDELEKKSSSSSSKGSSSSTVTDSVDSASVRSILSRAKNILKTLDIDNSGNDMRKKRFRIARPDKFMTRSTKQERLQKKMLIARNKQQAVTNHKRENEYPDNFILKSWYGK